LLRNGAYGLENYIRRFSPLKITPVPAAHPFYPFLFFIMEELLRAKNVISFLVAAICIEIFY
jgi:hypothetical protein